MTDADLARIRGGIGTWPTPQLPTAPLSWPTISPLAIDTTPLPTYPAPWG